MYKRKAIVELMGLMGTINPFILFNSASRIAMLANHVEQAPTPINPDIPGCLTGFESSLPTFDIRMPTDALVLSIHHKIRQGFDRFAIKENPEIVIIYQCLVTGKYDYISIPTYQSRHRVYGSKNIIMPIVNTLRAKVSRIAKGTLLAHSPCYKEGTFTNTVNAEVIYLSDPSTIEDGYVISKSFSERAALRTIQSIVGNYGRKVFPLNTYGNETEFKAFPDIGEQIRPDGLVFAFREWNDIFNPLELTNKALMDIDMIHDIRVYGEPGATVYDIKVESGIGESKGKVMTFPTMAAQANRYINTLSGFYDEILQSYDGICKNDKNYNLSGRLTNLITRAYGDKPNKYRQAGSIIRRTYKGIPLDEFRVELFITIVKPLEKGSKLTGKDGNKGVVCAIRDDDDMPVNSTGVRADMIGYFKGGITRLISGPFYTQYLNAASRDLRTWIVANINNLPLEVIWQRLLDYYAAASVLNYDIMQKYYLDVESRQRHLQSIIDDKIYLYIPPDSPHLGPSLFRNVEKVISPTYGPITYRKNGQTIHVKGNFFIGPQPILVLEKTDQHPMAVSSSVLQPHGFLAGSSKLSRTGHPSKVQAFRTFSEAEMHMYIGTIGPKEMSIVSTLNNSPEEHKRLLRIILRLDKPSSIFMLDDIDVGKSRPLMYINNTLTAYGLTLTNYETAEITD